MFIRGTIIRIGTTEGKEIEVFQRLETKRKISDKLDK